MERQELHCHNCGNYVQFDVDVEMNGNIKLECPVCGHEHYRVVEEGMITEERWGSANRIGQYYNQVYNITSSTASTYTAYMSGQSTSSYDSGTSLFLYSSWVNAQNRPTYFYPMTTQTDAQQSNTRIYYAT